MGFLDVLFRRHPECDSSGLWPKDTVKIYSPEDFEGKLDPNRELVMPNLIERHSGHFSDTRVAVMFKPSKEKVYRNIYFPVGYWTQVLGLGETPDGVKFEGNYGPHVVPANTENPGVGSLDTFWRGAENFASDCTFQKQHYMEDTKQMVTSVPTNLSGKNATSPINNIIINKGKDKDGNYINATLDNQNGMIWAVSQAAPIRRVHVKEHLHLSLGANCASGGFVGNLKVGGYVVLGSQQQYCLRNCSIGGKMSGGAWSCVLVGSNNTGGDGEKISGGTLEWALDGIPGGPPDGFLITNEPETSVRVEKPFIFVGEGGDDDKYYLGIPKCQKDSKGSGFENEVIEKVPIDNTETVMVVWPTHTYEEVQRALDQKMHVIFTPATHNFGRTLTVKYENQVVLGIGLATLQAPRDGSPCIHVQKNIGGVRISGILLEASDVGHHYKGSSLLKWGDASDENDGGNSDNPGAIHDLYCFVGGRSTDRKVSVECMVEIYSGNVVGDNLWLWRADHTKLKKGEKPNKPDLSEYHVTTYGECKCDIGLKVHGDNVIMNGLAVEHAYGNLVDWHGKGGKVFFYQSELPYDVSGDNYKDVAGYHVHETADAHVAKGIGVYSYFRDYHDVEVKSAIVDKTKDADLKNLFAVWLNGFPGINSVMNGEGDPINTQGHPHAILTDN